MQGIFKKGFDGTDINAVDMYSVDRDAKKRGQKKRQKGPDYKGLLVTADDFGFINLFKSPAHRPDAKFITHRGHSSHVTNIKVYKHSNEQE